MIHSNKRFQPNCLGELSLVPKSCWWGPLLLIVCSSQDLGLTARQRGRELHFFPTLSVISLCAKQGEQNHFTSLLNSEIQQKAGFCDLAGSISLFSYSSPLLQEPLNSLRFSLKRYLNSLHTFFISSDWSHLLLIKAMRKQSTFIKEATVFLHFFLSCESPRCPLSVYTVL